MTNGLNTSGMLLNEIKKNWLFSFPIIIGELTQLLFGLIDGPMLGNIDYHNLAAVSLINNVLILPFILCVGITIPISQFVSIAYGQKSVTRVSYYFLNGFWLSVITAVIMVFTVIAASTLIVYLHQDTQVVVLAKPYLFLMALSLIPMTGFLALKNLADSLGKSRLTMLFSIMGIPIKFILNYIFIYGRWNVSAAGITGAGLATLIARGLLFLVLFLAICMHPHFKLYVAVMRKHWMVRLSAIKKILRIGIPCAFQLFVELSALAVSGIFIGSMGAKQLAAHQIAWDCTTLVLMISLGLAQGTSIRICRAYGMGDWKKISVIAESSIYNTLILGFITGVVFILFRFKLPLIFTNAQGVTSIAEQLLIYAAFFQFSNALQVTSAVVLRSIQDVSYPTLYIVVAYWVIGLPLGYYLSIHNEVGVNGIWLGFISGLSVSAILLKYRMSKLLRRFLLQ